MTPNSNSIKHPALPQPGIHLAGRIQTGEPVDREGRGSNHQSQLSSARLSLSLQTQLPSKEENTFAISGLSQIGRGGVAGWQEVVEVLRAALGCADLLAGPAGLYWTTQLVPPSEHY